MSRLPADSPEMQPAGLSALAPGVEAWLTQLRVQRRLSDHSLAAYRRDASALLTWCNGQGISSFDQLDGEQLRAFIAAEHRRGLGPKSLQRRLSACRGLLGYLHAEGRTKIDASRGLRAPKAPRRLPQVLDADEMTRLVEVPTDDALGLRDRAMLELFYSSGLRLTELCTLRWGDIDLADGLVRVLGKGNKQRVLPIGRAALEALQAWRASGDGRVASYVFPGRGDGHLSQRAVQQRVKLAARQQGIWKRVHPHLLRHSCASHLLESSSDLRGVQEMLGHADIGTTQIYTHLDFQHLSRVFDATHPRAKRRG